MTDADSPSSSAAILARAGDWAHHVATNDPWTNVYGLARTVVASATALTLATTPAMALWSPFYEGRTKPPGCEGLRGAIGVFCVVPPGWLLAVQVMAIVGLVVVASGWRPRITGVVHWWIAFSFLASAAGDGGDQVAALFTLIVLPWTLTDRRQWHWQKLRPPTGPRLPASIVAHVCRWLVRLQVMTIYLQTGVTKLRVPEWLDGTAVYYWTHDPVAGVSAPLEGLIAPFVRSQPLMWSVNWLAIAIEFLLVTALVLPRRIWECVFWIGIAFHVGIGLGLGVSSFSIAMIGALIVYMRPLEKEFAWLKVRSHYSRAE